ncbi:hypothetical protein PRIPAC_97101, partial [Pristionchus pacificus]|uniref:Uncharacterized protein n=1 Tax=Pristionchus pacificus TaxID=54126 RepID=A0A2A6BK96_PRIPA
ILQKKSVDRPPKGSFMIVAKKMRCAAGPNPTKYKEPPVRKTSTIAQENEGKRRKGPCYDEQPIRYGDKAKSRLVLSIHGKPVSPVKNKLISKYTHFITHGGNLFIRCPRTTPTQRYVIVAHELIIPA